MKKTICILSLLSVAGAAHASNDISVTPLTQQEFRLFSEDMGAALSYKPLLPAEPLGITGFDVGVEVTATQLAHPAIFDKASNNSSIKTLMVPKVHLDKGLPFGIDVGAFVSKVPNSNISLTGAEIRYAFIPGGIAMPAVAVRATYSHLSGVSQLSFDTRGIDLTVSKGVAMLTPYAGIGEVWVDSTPQQVATLKAERFTLTKYYVGTNVNLGLMNLDLEADRTGDATSYGVKLGLRF